MVKLLVMASMSVSFGNNGASFPPIIALNYAAMMESFSVSNLNCSLLLFVILLHFNRVLKFIMTRLWSLMMSAPDFSSTFP